VSRSEHYRLSVITDGERRNLGLEALHAVLASHGVAARMLGPSVPAAALVAAPERTRPTAVVVWAQVSRTARTGSLRPLTRSAGQVIGAGPGWRLSRLPAGVLRVDSLPYAVTAIPAAVRLDDR
jgi:hypothetical protein